MSEIKVKYESGNEYSVKEQFKGLLTVYRNDVYVGSIGLATLAFQLENKEGGF